MIIIVYDAPHNEAFCIGYNIYCSWCIFQYHIHAFFILLLQLSHLFFCWNLYIWNAGSVWFANNLIVFFSELQFKWVMIKLLDWPGYLTSYFFRHECTYRIACLPVISFYVQFFKTSLFLTFSKYKYTLAHITEAFWIGYNIYCSWCIYSCILHFVATTFTKNCLFYFRNLYVWNAGITWFENNLIVFFSKLHFIMGYDKIVKLTRISYFILF